MSALCILPGQFQPVDGVLIVCRNEVVQVDQNGPGGLDAPFQFVIDLVLVDKRVPGQVPKPVREVLEAAAQLTHSERKRVERFGHGREGGLPRPIADFLPVCASRCAGLIQKVLGEVFKEGPRPEPEFLNRSRCGLDAGVKGSRRFRIRGGDPLFQGRQSARIRRTRSAQLIGEVLHPPYTQLLSQKVRGDLLQVVGFIQDKVRVLAEDGVFGDQIGEEQ